MAESYKYFQPVTISERETGVYQARSTKWSYQLHSIKHCGNWNGGQSIPLNASADYINDITTPVAVFSKDDEIYIGREGTATLSLNESVHDNGEPLIAYAPALYPEHLGDRAFKKAHNLNYAYIIGAIANGITSEAMVIAASKAGMLGFFGAGGLSIERISTAIDTIKTNVGTNPFGFNLIHSPGALHHEQAVVDLYLQKQVHLVSAAAYMLLTEPLIQYRLTGIHRDATGTIVCPNKVIAKVSRVEVARQFFSPAPAKAVRRLLEKKLITPEEAELSAYIPVAEDLTAEADSGGHTDNRPALALLPTMIALRDDMLKQHQYQTSLRVGMGGGISTPESAAAAFSMGAAYILTGSVNQSCREAGTSDTVKQLLAKTEQADVIMAPAADMFEMGVKVQVLKRGTMFALRGSKLYDYYRNYDSIESMPESIIADLEKKYFRIPVDQEWQNTEAFFTKRDPSQLERVKQDPKHKIALLFRSYLGRASLWAINGEPDRAIDYQIWCGPAMGAFNDWVKGTFLEKPENRNVAIVAMNLLVGACVVTRASWLRQQGVSVPPGAGKFLPLVTGEIKSLFE